VARGYDSNRLQTASGKVLSRQSVAGHQTAGVDAKTEAFTKLQEDAATLLLLRPPTFYVLAGYANNGVRALLKETITDLEETILALLDSTRPSVAPNDTVSLAAASSALGTAADVMQTSGSSRATSTLLGSYGKALDDFVASGLQPNVQPAVGAGAARVGAEALSDAVTHFDDFIRRFLQLQQRILWARRTVTEVTAEDLRRRVSSGIVDRTKSGVDAAVDYYDTASDEEAARTASSVALNLLAGKAALSAVQQARGPADPKIRSKDLSQDPLTAIPEGTDYVLLPLEDGSDLVVTGSSPVARLLPAGTQLLYEVGDASFSADIPGAGLYAVLGTVDVIGLTIPAGVYLYIETGGVTYPIQLPAGAADVADIVDAINAAGTPVTAEAFGDRLLLTCPSAFTLPSTFDGDAPATVTSDDITFPVGDGVGIQVILQDVPGQLRILTATMGAGVWASNMAALVAAMQPLEQDGAETVAAVSSDGDKLVVSSVAEGQGVSITIDQVSTTIQISWTAPTGVGALAEPNQAVTLLGLTETATLETDPSTVVEAVKGGGVTPSLDADGHLVLTVLDEVEGTVLTILDSVGLAELGLVAGDTHATTALVEVVRRVGDDTPLDLTTFGIAAGDRLQLHGEAQVDLEVVVAPTGTDLQVTPPVRLDMGDTPFVITDASYKSFYDTGTSLQRLLSDQAQSRVPNIRVLRALRERVAAASGRGAISAGAMRKALVPLVDLLSLLTASPPQATDIDAGLVSEEMARPTSGRTYEDSLALFSPTVDVDSQRAVDSLLASLEEHGFDRAAEFLVNGRVQDFLDLSSATASQSGNLEAALTAVAQDMAPPKSSDAQAEDAGRRSSVTGDVAAISTHRESP